MGLLIPITALIGLKSSMIWIALRSVQANFIGHFSSWQAARAEVTQDQLVENALGTATEARAEGTGEHRRPGLAHA